MELKLLTNFKGSLLIWRTEQNLLYRSDEDKGEKIQWISQVTTNYSKAEVTVASNTKQDKVQ